MTLFDLARAFVSGYESNTPKPAFWTHGAIAYSYDEPIAFRYGGVLFVTTDRWSKTTSKHVNRLIQLAAHLGVGCYVFSFVRLCLEQDVRRGELFALLPNWSSKEFVQRAQQEAGKPGEDMRGNL